MRAASGWAGGRKSVTGAEVRDDLVPARDQPVLFNREILEVFESLRAFRILGWCAALKRASGSCVPWTALLGPLTRFPRTLDRIISTLNTTISTLTSIIRTLNSSIHALQSIISTLTTIISTR